MVRPFEDQALLRDAPEGDDDRAISLPGGDALDTHTRRDLLREERTIAMGFHGSRYMWVYPVLTTLCFAAWVSCFPLAIAGVMRMPSPGCSRLPTVRPIARANSDMTMK